jgi:hypothetical protein
MTSKILSATIAAGMLFGAAGIAAAQSDKEQKLGQPGAQQQQMNQKGTSGTEAGTQSTQPGTIQENRASGASGTTSGQAPVGTTQPATGGMKKPDEQKK